MTVMMVILMTEAMSVMGGDYMKALVMMVGMELMGLMVRDGVVMVVRMMVVVKMVVMVITSCSLFLLLRAAVVGILKTC